MSALIHLVLVLSYSIRLWNISYSVWDYFFNTAHRSPPLLTRLSGEIIKWRIAAQATQHLHPYHSKAIMKCRAIVYFIEAYWRNIFVLLLIQKTNCRLLSAERITKYPPWSNGDLVPEAYMRRHFTYDNFQIQYTAVIHFHILPIKLRNCSNG